MTHHKLRFIIICRKRDRDALKPIASILSHFEPEAVHWLAPEAWPRHVFGPRDIAILFCRDADERQGFSALNRPCLWLLPQAWPKQESMSAQQQVMRWPGDQNECRIKLGKLVRWFERRESLGGHAMLVSNLIGSSQAFRRVLDDIRRFAPCDAPVLISGETGTGKEQVARAIHYLGLGDKPFVAVNCGAVPDNLFENELFGHVRGAYTDARQNQRGLVEMAEGGSLFLDEIEALSNKGQVALLRFLQDYEYRPLGAQKTRRARLRIITASNEPLMDWVAQGRFRKDLFYRINILSIALPPLRQRGEDIVHLAEHFVDKYRQLYRQYDKYLAPRALQWMRRHDWPGNVRELENLILRCFLLSDGPCIELDVAAEPQERRRNPFDRRCRHLYQSRFQEAKAIIVGEFEKNYLCYMLEQARGNVSEAARRAGKERKSFVKLMEKHGLQRSHFLRQ